jgi:hypothetical protein
MLMLILLCGCASTVQTTEDRYAKSYAQGYTSGCNSGKWYDLNLIKEKDYKRVTNDKGYAKGWDEGFTNCRYTHSPEQ